MKTILYDLPEVTSTSTTITSFISINDTILEVTDSSNFSTNDFVLIEEQGNERVELRKISSIDSATQITLTEGCDFEHLESIALTKISYDKYKIERSDDNVSFTDVTTEELEYSHPKQKIEYFDESSTASDDLYYRISYVNSHTTTEVVQDTLYKQENFSYITPTDFRNETDLTSDLLSSSLLYPALVSGVEFIRDKLYVTKTFTASSATQDTYFIYNEDNMYFADYDGDRKITKDDIYVFEHDPSTELRTYIPHKIQRMVEKTKTIFFTEALPRDGKELTVMIPMTFKPFDDIRHNLRQVNKLLAINYVLRNTKNQSVRSTILNWTAGGTSVNREPLTVATAIEQNMKDANRIISDILSKIYSQKTRLRTNFSYLNNRYRGGQGTILTPSGGRFSY